MNHDFLNISRSDLFPVAEEQKLVEQFLDTLLHETQGKMREGRVAPNFDRKKFSSELSFFDFSRPTELEALLPWVVGMMRDGNVQITHPRYFGLFNPAPAFPSILADRIVDCFNLQLASAKTSPAAVALEAHVIAQIGQRIGFDAGSIGHFTNSGSEANFTALICALTDVIPAFRENGALAIRMPVAIYVSRDAHLCWLKIAHQAGIGRLSVRMIETDGQGQMCGIELRKAVATDIDNGVLPVMVVGTAGTTVAGKVDPLRECAAIAEQANAWFHVDAAWAGAAIASERARPALAGIELADSVTIDAHKWFATTMACGMFITSKSDVLGKAFGVTASFMPPSAVAEDPYANSVMWSRRFLGLQLFMNLATAGWEGYGRYVDNTLKMMRSLQEILESMGWRTANPGALGVLCTIPPNGFKPVPAIVDEIVSSGHAWVSAATFEGREVVRICITNGRTEAQDLDALAAFLNFSGSAAFDRKAAAN